MDDPRPSAPGSDPPILRERVNLAILALCALCSLAVVARGRVAHDSPKLVALCASNAVILVMLEKRGTLHYFVLPMVPILAWEINEGRWPWLAVIFGAVLSHLFVLAFSMETQIYFNRATGLVMVALLGALWHLTRAIPARVSRGSSSA
jgi:hypothetical protein